MEKILFDASQSWVLRREVRRLFELEDALATAELGPYSEWQAAVEELAEHKVHLRELVEVHA